MIGFTVRPGVEDEAIVAAAPTALDRRLRFLLVAGVAVTLLAFIRVVTDSPELSSSGSYGAALRLGVPILLAALGGLFAERAGIVNIGLEGMLILGTWFGAWGAWHWGPWWGALAGVLGGGLGGLLHAVATVTFGIDHIISGVAVNILAGGVARFLSVVTYTEGTGGGATQSPGFEGDIAHLTIPLLSDATEFLEERNWFLISDVGGLLNALFEDVSWLTVIALALVPLSYLFLWRTRTGLRVRSVGEHPMAAESLGVPVYRMKYLGVVVSGALAGLGGAFLVLEQAGIYREGQTGGRGFIALAALIFGNWRPGGILAGAALFGYASALELRSEGAVHALLLFVAIAGLGLAALAVWRRQVLRSAVLGITGAAFLIWFLASDEVPRQFIPFTPHLTTLLVLAFAAQNLRPPAADGLPYRRGQAA